MAANQVIRMDPPVGFHFKVSFGFIKSDTGDSHFQEVSGFTAELGTEELIEGGENRFVHRLPTRGKYGNLILKRGLFTDSELIDWCRGAIENLDIAPTEVLVSLLNEDHEPVGDSFNFKNAWPVKWAVTDYKAQENSLVVETLELTYNYFTRTRLSKQS